MKLEKLDISNEGFVHCHSCFYSSKDILIGNTTFSFTKGINKLYGEIDSGVWAISYLLSMYVHKTQDFALFKQQKVRLNNEHISFDELSKYTCYMDVSYPLFSSNCSVKQLISNGLEKNDLYYTPEEIRKIFELNDERFERPLVGLGNEIFKAMAAIGFCNKKELFCFPWLSQKRFDYYHKNISCLLRTLDQLDKTVILPLGEALRP